MRINRILVGAVLVSGAGLSGVAGAAVIGRSSAPTVIYACAAKQNGAVRLVSKPSKCTTKETTVSWNRSGPRGEKGARGTTGLTGPSGVAGIQNVGEVFYVSASSSLLADVQCPDGTVPIGGGAHFSNAFTGRGSAAGGYVSEEDIDDSGTGWAATLVNTYGVEAEFAANAICATTSS